MNNHAEQTFPELHDGILNSLNNILQPIPYFKHGGNQALNNCQDEYDTFVMAKFTCDNPQCSKRGWRSGKVTILIRGYQDNGYHAVVFNQRCERCNQLGALELDQPSYIDRVTYRLKKWAGFNMGTRSLREKKETPPHKSHLCEGCSRGYCELYRGQL
ncbi:zinc-binding domain-containing protein [Triangularia verruculosa]|uniref:Zinc-binding domain-containing protein n=1 Tax=Triangularia verruculosa TaxID=2587418 RepID=A0AAN7AVF3_9PEZI|nr:zinc-binding domain-containing protein [Triangularia verruculosa]